MLLGLALLLVNAVALHGDLSRAWISLVAFFVILLAVATRWLLAHTRRALVPLGIGLERYALVGDDASGRRLLDDLTRAPGAPYTVVEVLPRSLTPESLVERAQALHVDGLILPADIESAVAARLATALSGAGIDVLLAPGLGGLDLRVASIAMLHGVPLLRAAGLSPEASCDPGGCRASADPRCGHHGYSRHPRELRGFRDVRRAAGAVSGESRSPGDRVLPSSSRHRGTRVARGPSGDLADHPAQIPRHGGPQHPVRRAPDNADPDPRCGALQRRECAGVAAASDRRSARRHERRRSRVAPGKVGCAGSFLVPDGGVAVGALRQRPGH